MEVVQFTASLGKETLRHLQYNEELIPWFTLYYNLLAILKLHWLQSISHRQTLPFIQWLWEQSNKEELKSNAQQSLHSGQ